MEFVEKVIPHLFVCTVNYNNIGGLKRTIESYINIPSSITYSVIIVDGGSIDGSAELIESLDIDYIIEKDRGTYDAMNKGIEWAYKNVFSARSYLIFMNSGDKFANDINFLGEDLANNSSDILVYKNYTDQMFEDKRYQIKLLKYGYMPICHQSIIYSLTSLEKSEIIYSLDTWSFNDYRQIYVLFNKGKSIEYRPNYLSIYDQNTASGLSRSNWKFRIEKLKVVYSLSGLSGLSRLLWFKIASKLLKVET